MAAKSMRLVLASASPRRFELLSSLGIPLLVEPPDLDESIWPNERANSYVARIAKAKAQVVREKFPRDFVLAADTTVAIDISGKEQILLKPESPEDAARMLRSLSGVRHIVLTGFCLYSPGGLVPHEQVVATSVAFVSLSEAEIQWYINTGEPLDKAGAYAIQGQGGRFIERIEGSYSNVVGLPLAEVCKALRDLQFELVPRICA